jgi:hypothetical protein
VDEGVGVDGQEMDPVAEEQVEEEGGEIEMTHLRIEIVGTVGIVVDSEEDAAVGEEEIHGTEKVRLISAKSWI